MNKKPEELYNERLKRFDDALQLKIPDRVPFIPHTHFFAVRYFGITSEEAFYNTDKWIAANKRMILDFEPDMYFPLVAALPGTALDLLDCKQVRWPGHGVSSHSSFQFVESENMREDEYELFLCDPSDYIIRVYLPRVFGTLKPLSTLPSIQALFIQGYKGAITSSVLADPSVTRAFESLYRAGLEGFRYRTSLADFDREMAGLGFPQAFGPSAYAPFDIISDYLRGMRGAMLDMYRQPDKLLEAMDRIFPTLLKTAVDGAQRSGNPRVFIPLHRGADGFMSLKQFEVFYWPGLKKLILSLIDEGLTPCPFFEGDYTTRLRYLCELPRGKVIGFFDSTDLFRAKEMVGSTLCIAGNMPSSLLTSGTPEQIKEYSKKLIDVVGKAGGFIMSSRGVLDDAKPELVKIWADFTREYGTYS